MVVVVRPGDGGSTTSLVARTRSPSLRVQVGFGRGVLVTCSVRVGLAIAEFFSVNFLFCSVVCNLCWMNLASARREDYRPGRGGQFNLRILQVFACYVVGDEFAHLLDHTRPPHGCFGNMELMRDTNKRTNPRGIMSCVVGLSCFSAFWLIAVPFVLPLFI